LHCPGRVELKRVSAKPDEKQVLDHVRAILIPFVASILILAVVVFKTWAAGDSLKDLPGNMLLLTPFAHTTIQYWNAVVDDDHYPSHKNKYNHSHVPIVEAADYSMESLRRATGFTHQTLHCPCHKEKTLNGR
jgi:hypothetical protein